MCFEHSRVARSDQGKSDGHRNRTQALGSAARLAAGGAIALVAKLANGPVSQKKLVSVYFDTPEFKLRDSGLTLRIRRIGRKRLQTIKSTGGGMAGCSDWEEETPQPTPNRLPANNCPVVLHAQAATASAVFKTDARRITMPLRFGRSDVGRARPWRRSGPAGAHASSEIELELKSGRRSYLALRPSASPERFRLPTARAKANAAMR